MDRDARGGDPLPGVRRRIRSLGLAGFALGILYAMTVISDPPVEGADAIHPWVVLALTLYALTPAPRRDDAPFGTPGGHLVRAGVWALLVASAAWNTAVHGGQDTLLLVVGVGTVVLGLVNLVLRVLLARARPA